jgi:hypothetical protein
MWKVQEFLVLMKVGLCSKCFSSGVDIITDEKNPESSM